MHPDYVYGDTALTIIATLVAVSTAWRMSSNGRSLAQWALFLGWTTFASRLWWLMYWYGDAPIHPVGIVALSLIGTGTICIHLRSEVVRLWSRHSSTS